MSAAPSDQPSDEQRRLRWRCRRGMRELDVLLTAYLDTCYEQAPAKTQQDFAYLLEQEDDQLWDWLLGRSVPEESRLAAIVAEVVDPERGASAPA